MDHRKFSRDATGVHTVEGNLAGARAARLTKQRNKDQEAFEQKKRKIAEEQERRTKGIDGKFALSSSDQHESSFRTKKYGLVTAEEFRRAREEIERGVHGAGGTFPTETKAGEDRIRVEEVQPGAAEKRKRDKKKMKKRKRAMLSFGEDEEEPAAAKPTESPAEPSESAEPPEASDRPVSKLKNPAVDTDFLPDRLREEALQREKLRLEREWREEQERLKAEALEVTYSYWDGSGHRRSLTVTKGTTIGKFVEKVRQQLIPEFPELRTTASDELIYVKEDLMIPHHYSFYDMIVTKARGKSGPLFHFDVHEDVRLTNDATVEKDESHPGKVVDRRWYDRNRHIFPATRWEVYDPRVQRGKYTIHGGEVSAK